MALTPGTRLGPYEIAAPIGAGGMGEVYRARDTKLNRDVALKVLPEAFALDADRLARFTREAQTLASLNHPNIAHIHGLEESGGVRALVMELVEGEDLSAIIARGPISVADALPLAKQIADALEAAHEQGIIHRDLKPANIKLKGAWGPTPTRLPDGRLAPAHSASDVAGCTVKVLDFGLAKARTEGAEVGGGRGVEIASSPTMTSPAMTAMGMILGTAPYMAPEQARGKIVDRRADIWAFGVVLYEMLSGRRAFEGEDVSDLLVAVLSKDVDLEALPAATPPRLRAIVRDCLVRDPKQRLRDIGDARRVLDKIIAGAADDVVAMDAAAATAPSPSRALPWAVACALAAALGIVWWAPWRGASSPAGASELRLTPLSFEQGGQTGAVWSPDGKAVAYAARQKDTDPYQVYVRYLDSPAATQITKESGGVQFVLEWTTAGKIVFIAGQVPWSVSPVGGEPQPWAAAAIAAGAQRKLQLVGPGSVSRDGTAMAGLFRSDDGVVSLWTGRLDSGMKPYEHAPFASRALFNTPTVKFSSDGKQVLVLLNTGAGEEAWLMSYPADAANPPHRILQSLSNSTDTPMASWMPDNRHVVLSASPSTAAPRQLYMADTVSGVLTILSSGTRAQNFPAVSPDGRRLAFLESEIDRDIVSVDLASAVVSPVITTQRNEQMAAWASRESAMVYITDRNGALEIWLQKPGQPDRPLVTARDFPSET